MDSIPYLTHRNRTLEVDANPRINVPFPTWVTSSFSIGYRMMIQSKKFPNIFFPNLRVSYMSNWLVYGDIQIGQWTRRSAHCVIIQIVLQSRPKLQPPLLKNLLDVVWGINTLTIRQDDFIFVNVPYSKILLFLCSINIR